MADDVRWRCRGGHILPLATIAAHGDAPAGSPVTLIVPGAIRTSISADARLGDGTFYGRVEKIFKEGMAMEECRRGSLMRSSARRRKS